MDSIVTIPKLFKPGIMAGKKSRNPQATMIKTSRAMSLDKFMIFLNNIYRKDVSHNVIQALNTRPIEPVELLRTLILSIRFYLKLFFLSFFAKLVRLGALLGEKDDLQIDRYLDYIFARQNKGWL